MSTLNRIEENWWKISKEEEYKKNSLLKSSDVEIIQEWMKKQPHLPALNDNQIIMFIRACEYSLAQTKLSIDLNYSMRTKYPEFFSKRDVNRKNLESVKEYLKIAMVRPKEKQNNIIVAVKVNEVDISKFCIDETIKLFLMFQDLTHMEFGSADGYIYIVDLKYISLSLVLRLPIITIGNMLRILQDCSTYRIKAVHFINGGPVFKKLLHLFQQFVKSEIIEVIQLHENNESLRKTLDINAIPSDYDGKAPSLEEQSKESLKILEKYKDWFVKEENQRYDEKKKIGNKTEDSVHQGSFRKLNID